MKVTTALFTVLVVCLVGAVAETWDEHHLTFQERDAEFPSRADTLVATAPKTYSDLEQDAAVACAPADSGKTWLVQARIARIKVARRVAAVSLPADLPLLKNALKRHEAALVALNSGGPHSQKCQLATLAVSRANPVPKLAMSPGYPSEADAYAAELPADVEGAGAQSAANQKLRAAFEAGQAAGPPDETDQASDAATGPTHYRVPD
jgi:hypothetical protein